MIQTYIVYSLHPLVQGSKGLQGPFAVSKYKMPPTENFWVTHFFRIEEMDRFKIES